YTTEQLLPFQRTAEGLAQWLTTTGAIGAVGEPVKLALRGGGNVNGKVLARTKTETEFSWTEENAVIGLKAFSMGPQKVIAVHYVAWEVSSERAKELEQQMERALESLSQALGAMS